MPRLTADQWETVRADREAGMSFAELSSKHGVSVGAIHARAKAEHWGDGQDVAEAIRRRATERLNAIPNGVHPKRRAEAIDAAASRVVEVVEKHQTEWQEHRELFPTADIKADFDLGKSAKISAEMLKIRQEGERKAYGLDKEDTTPTIVIERGTA